MHSPEILLSDYLMCFVERSRDVFWIRSADYTRQIFVSKAFESVWGQSRDALYANPGLWEKYLHPDDKARLRTSLAKRTPNISVDSLFTEHYRILRPDGSIRWIKDESFPLMDEKHRLIAFAGIAQDISFDKQKEAGLKQILAQAIDLLNRHET